MLVSMWDNMCSDETSQLCTFFPKQVWEFDYNALKQWFVFDHIDYGFHKSLTQTNPCMNFYPSHNVHSQLWHSLVNLLNIKSHQSLSHVAWKCYICGPIAHIWDVRMIIKSIYLSISSRYGISTNTHPHSNIAWIVYSWTWLNWKNK